MLPGWAPADAISGVVLGLLLAASISTWAVLLHQAFRLRRVQHDLRLSRALFWQAPDWQQALQVLNDTEKEGLLGHLAKASQAPAAGTLAASTSVTAQTERALRDALHQASARLHHGHTFLASVAASAVSTWRALATGSRSSQAPSSTRRPTSRATPGTCSSP